MKNTKKKKIPQPKSLIVTASHAKQHDYKLGKYNFIKTVRALCNFLPEKDYTTTPYTFETSRYLVFGGQLWKIEVKVGIVSSGGKKL